MEYLDREGGKYLATKLKSYVDNKFTGGGTVDLTNYYTKEWCQNINSTSQNEKFQIHISMVQQRQAEGGSHMAK